jgi:bis(5'-adenosyl)-triphosphatase
MTGVGIGRSAHCVAFCFAFGRSTAASSLTVVILLCFAFAPLGALLQQRTFSLQPFTTSMSSSKQAQNEPFHFSNFVIPAESIFYASKKSVAFVNLKPIVPGHILVGSKRIVPQLQDLHEDEYLDLWSCVRHVQKIIKQHYNCTAFTISVQDGRAAGQSVPHVHVHVLPRSSTDTFSERNDDVYTELQQWAPRNDEQLRVKQHAAGLKVPDDRKDRTLKEMFEEAALYRQLFDEGMYDFLSSAVCSCAELTPMIFPFFIQYRILSNH